MASPLLIYPGEVGHLVEVNDILEERHQALLAARAAELAARAAAGTPLDDLEPMVPFVPDPHVVGIKIQPRALSERERRSHELQEAACWRRLKEAQQLEDADTRDHALVEATDRLYDQRRHFLLTALEAVEVAGARGGHFRIDGFQELFDALERSRLFMQVFQAAAAAQELSAGKAWRSGRPPASTSSGSTAGSAQSTGVLPGAATVALDRSADAPRTSPVSGSRPTHAPGGT